MPYIKVDNINIHYTGGEGKPGPTVLFCHGSGGTHRVWRNQISGLSDIANPVAIDLPGHGLSGGHPLSTIAEYTTFLQKFCSDMNLSGMFLAGHSMGGAIALEYALKYPEEIAGLILVATGGRLRVSPAILEGYRSGKVSPKVAEFTFGPNTSPELLSQWQEEMSATPAEVYAIDFAACDQFDRLAELPQINKRTLVFGGGADQLTPLKYGRYLEQHMPNAELVVIEEAGHMPMLEAPDLVNQAIARFLGEG